MVWFRVLALCLLASACTPTEVGTVRAQACPPCSDAFAGFATCAFYEVDAPWAREDMLIDHSQYAGVGTPVRVSGLMHHKFCYNASHVVFGSANPTVYGLLVSDNLIVSVESAVLAKNFAGEYAYLQNNTALPHTRQFILNDRPVEHVFCPRHACEDMLLSYIYGAEKEIIFLTFAFTSRPVADALIAAHQRGVLVRGVFDALSAGSRYSQYHTLKDAGIEVFVVRPERGVMHHKAFVIDDTAVVGSYNPSENANKNNAETLIALKEPVVVGAVRDEFVRLAR